VEEHEIRELLAYAKGHNMRLGQFISNAISEYIGVHTDQQIGSELFRVLDYDLMKAARTYSGFQA
jgi:hypothetical protein